jgi:hypothetical protein
MAMRSFVFPFREPKFCGVPSCVFDKSGSVMGEKKAAEHWVRGREGKAEEVSQSETRNGGGGGGGPSVCLLQTPKKRVY